jgi:hypothetical protein
MSQEGKFRGFTAEGYEFSGDEERLSGMIVNRIVSPEADDPAGQFAAQELLDAGKEMIERGPDWFADALDRVEDKAAFGDIAQALPFVDAQRTAELVDAGLEVNDPEARVELIKTILVLGMLEQEAAPRLMAQVLSDSSFVVKKKAEEAMSLIAVQAATVGVGGEFADSVRLALAGRN